MIRAPHLVELTLVRHARAEGEGTARGWLDAPLTAEGRAQTEALAAALGATSWDTVWGSDLARAWALAGRFPGARPDARLREQHFGAWEGRSWPVWAEASAEERAFLEGAPGARPPEGESVDDLAARVAPVWAAVLGATPPGGRALAVTHAGVIRVTLCAALGVPLEAARRFAPAPGSWCRLAVHDAGAVLTHFGCDPPR